MLSGNGFEEEQKLLNGAATVPPGSAGWKCPPGKCVLVVVKALQAAWLQGLLCGEALHATEGELQAHCGLNMGGLLQQNAAGLVCGWG